MPDDFVFEEDSHRYISGDGIVRPSVTQSLRDQGIFDYSMVSPAVLENARRRGSNVHRWTAEHDQYGSIDESWIAEDERGYFYAWLAFLRDAGPKIVAIERPMLRKIDGIEVGGTPDRLMWLGRTLYFNDLKCCAAKHPGWALQLADYEMMQTGKPRCGHMGRMVTQLSPTGKYNCIIYDDAADGDVAIAALVLTNWEEHPERDADAARRVLDTWKRNVGLAA